MDSSVTLCDVVLFGSPLMTLTRRPDYTCCDRLSFCGFSARNCDLKVSRSLERDEEKKQAQTWGQVWNETRSEASGISGSVSYVLLFRLMVALLSAGA